MFYKQFKKLFVLALFIVLIFPTQVSAISVSPSTGDYQAGEEITLQILATPTAVNQTAVTLDLHFYNLEIISATLPETNDEWLVVIPECDNESSFTSSSLCATLGKTVPVQVGDILATLRVKFISDGPAYVQAGENNAYASVNSTSPVAGYLTAYNGFVPQITTSIDRSVSSTGDSSGDINIGGTYISPALALVGGGILLLAILIGLALVLRPKETNI